MFYSQQEASSTDHGALRLAWNTQNRGGVESSPTRLQARRWTRPAVRYRGILFGVLHVLSIGGLKGGVPMA